MALVARVSGQDAEGRPTAFKIEQVGVAYAQDTLVVKHMSTRGKS